MANPNVETSHRLEKAFKVISVATARGDGSRNEALSPITSPTQIQKVSLVKLTPLEATNATRTSALSPNTLNRLVEEQAKSHEAIEELEQSAVKQRNVLNQILGTPVPSSPATLSKTRKGIQSAMLDISSDAMHSTPLAQKLFPAGSDFGDDIEHEILNRKDSNRRNKKSDTDNDTGVESDTGSDPCGEDDGIKKPRVEMTGVLPTKDPDRARHFSPMGKTAFSRESNSTRGKHKDELLVYLEIIEQKALAVESLIEQAKLDTVLHIRKQIEAEFNGVPLQEIPAKCHQKIDRAIQRYLERELEKIRANYENKEAGSEPHGEVERIDRESKQSGMGRGRPSDEIQDLERENDDLRDRIGGLEVSVDRVDRLYLMQKKENEYLTEKVTKLERQLANEKLRYENDLNNVKNDFEETRKDRNFSKEKTIASKIDFGNDSETMVSLYRKLEQEEKQNKALRVAGEADQTTIRCLEGKASELERELQNSRREVSDLLQEIRELQGHAERRDRKLQECEAHLKEVLDERRVLRETLVMSEHEISLLENKLGDDNSGAWKDSKKEILGELRKLEKHIKVIHKEKRKLENKYLAFKIENEHLSDSLHSFSKTKDILTPMSSCNVSRNQSTLSSHSSSRSSSLAGSDLEDEEAEDSRHVSRGRIAHGTGRRRKRSVQDQKDKKFAEAVARKLMFAQQVLKDQNCNFSSFENSGDDLINEADQLVKKVDSLQAEKLAIKMELESVRSAQPVS
ncbi:cingulin-like isoform X2 [Dendronephthya gigantea]|uniref:cingulin-like isoform X2 n=1 Tax=Dendronephthya gigantea TaxID=151771 RepID=UPI00106933FB|nr:cingulin-like isoform X2 [Dendronephthya gigantea]